jgi:chromosome segregation ATPase
MVDRVTASTSTDPRAGTEGSLEIRLASLANALGRTLRDLRDRLEALERRLTERVDAVEHRVADLPDNTAQTTADLRAVLRHLEALQQRASATPGELSGKVEAIEQRLSSLPGAVSAKVDQATEGMRKSFEALPPAISKSFEPIRELPKRIEEAMAAVEDMRNRVAALEGGITRVRDESDAALTGLTKHVSERLDEMTARVGEVVGQVREVHKRSSEGTASTDQRLAKIDERLSMMADQLVDPVELARTAQEATEQALAAADLSSVARQATESALVTFGEEQDRRSAALEKALGRVDALSDALGSLEKRRGVRELLEGEQQLLEQQRSLVQTVTETADQLGGRVLSIEGEISAILERVDEKRLSIEVGEQVKGAVVELQKTIAHELGTRLSNAITAISKAAADQVASDVGARVENLREELSEEAIKAGTKVFMTAGAGLQDEIGAMRAKIDAWGRSRTAPKVAEELTAMNKRIDKVALTVEEELVDAVFDRMQRVFDRRFEVLIQLVESRITAALDKREELPQSHRRRFIRRGEED